MLLLSDYKQASHRKTRSPSSKEPHKLVAHGSISALQVILRGKHIIYEHYQIKYAFPNAGNKIYSIEKVLFHRFLQLHSDVTNILPLDQFKFKSGCTIHDLCCLKSSIGLL